MESGATSAPNSPILGTATPCPQTKLRNLLIDPHEGGGDAVIMEGLVARDDLATPASPLPRSQYSGVSQCSE